MIPDIGRLLQHLAEFPSALQFLLSAVAAAFTEEISSVAVFGLARAGKMDWAIALGSVFTGTLVINIGLWWAGRATGARALHWKMFQDLNKERLDSLHRHVHREGWIAVAVARFVPGTRIPVFVLAGILGMDARAYVLTQIGATLVWMATTLGLMHLVVELALNQPWILVAVAAVIVSGALWFKFRRKPAKKS
jgi:membrane protein DedA with SNARE-associated domain